MSQDTMMGCMLPSDDAVIWRYGEHAFEADMFEPAFAARYETALEAMQRDTERSPKDVKTSVAMEGIAGRIRAFLDTLFGEGTAGTLLGESLNARRATNCFVSLMSFCKEQSDATNNATNAMLGVAQNRQQRRAAERAKR